MKRVGCSRNIPGVYVLMKTAEINLHLIVLIFFIAPVSDLPFQRCNWHTDDFAFVIVLERTPLHMHSQVKSGNKEKNFKLQQKQNFGKNLLFSNKEGLV